MFIAAAAGHSHWYTSGTFYAAVGAIAVVVIGASTVWATLFVGSTKRRITYSLTEDTPLLATTTALAKGELEVLYKGQHVAAPRCVTVRLVSRGRRDIGSNDFDGQRPIAIDLGVPIVKRLATSAVPDMPKSDFDVDGTKLMIGPCRIRKRQVMSFTFLVNGGRPSLTHDDSLLNVDVRAGSDGGEPKRLTYVMLVALGALALSSGAMIAWFLAAFDR